MPSALYLNNFDSQLTGVVKAAPDTGTPATEIGYGVLQLPGAVGATLPTLTGGNWFMLTLFKLVEGLEDDIEIVKVTAVDTSSGSETRITVERAQEGTTAQAYVIGDKVSLRMTAGSAANKLQKTNNLSDLPSIPTARTNLGLGTAALVNTGTGATEAILGNDARLTDSRIPTGAAGGVLSGTYPNPGFAVDMATQAELTDHISDTTGAHDGTAITNTPAGSISATTVQAAINELDSEKEPSITAGTSAQYWRGNKTWADFFTDVRASTLTGLSTAVNAVITASDTVLSALGKLQKQVSDNLTTLTGHTGAASGAHAATAISNTPAGTIAATTVQAAIDELDTEKVAKSGDTMTGPLAQAAGTALLPSYTFSGDTNTGMWSPAADTVAVSTGGSEVLRIDSSGNVGIGTAAPGSKLVAFAGAAGGVETRAFELVSGFADGNTGTAIRLTNSTVQNSTAGSVEIAAIRNAADPGAAFVLRSSSTAPSMTERLRIDSSGNVLVTGSGGLGYGVGSGGSVTQVTNRNTGVILNKPTGLITLVGATTTAGTFNSFTLTNSSIGAGDLVVAHIVSGATADRYSINVTAVAAGSCRIQIHNIAAVGVSESPSIRFAVIKGTNS